MDTYDKIEKALRMLQNAHEAWAAQDGMSMCRYLGNALESQQEIAAEAVQLAYDQGATKKAIALALDIPASTLRGMKKTNGSPGPRGLQAMLP